MMAAVEDCSRNEAPRAFLPSLAGEVQIEPCRAQRRQKRALLATLLAISIAFFFFSVFGQTPISVDGGSVWETDCQPNVGLMQGRSLWLGQRLSQDHAAKGTQKHCLCQLVNLRKKLDPSQAQSTNTYDGPIPAPS